jgi:hypothetical protein
VTVRYLACTYHGFGCANGHASASLLALCAAGLGIAIAITALLRKTGR